MIPFTLAQVEAFRTIVRLGSVSAAAVRLGITQPSVTQRVRELEAALGVRLFMREGRGVRPTPEARAFLDYADRLMGAAQEAIDRFRAHDPLHGILRFGVTDSFAMVALPTLLQRLEARYPQLKTAVRVDDSGTMSRMLEDGELDIAIIGDPDTGPNVSREHLGTNQLAWIERADGEPAPGPLTPADLAQRHLIVAAPPSRLHRAARRWFEAVGVEPQRMSLCNSLAVTVRIAFSGHATGLIPAEIVRREIEAGIVRQVAVRPEPPQIRFHLCYRTGEFGPGVAAVLELARSLAREHRLFL